MAHEPAPPMPAWLQAMVPYDRYSVRVTANGDERRMHVMEAGQPDGRPVVLVHGNPTWGFLYRKVVAELGDAPLRLVMPDLIGLGLSDKPTEPGKHTLDNHAAWMRSLFDALDLKDAVIVVQDWGGPIGVLGAEGRMGGIVVLNTVLSPPKPGFRPTLFHRLSQTPVISELVFRGLGFPQVALWMAQGDRSTMRGEAARAYRWPLRKRAETRAPLEMARMVPDSPDHPSIAALQRCQDLIEAFDGPAAIVWGDKDPVLGSVRNWLARLLPQADVTRTKAGHFLQEEVPAEIAAAIRTVALG